MINVQTQVEEKLHRVLKTLAAQRGVPIKTLYYQALVDLVKKEYQLQQKGDTKND